MQRADPLALFLRSRSRRWYVNLRAYAYGGNAALEQWLLAPLVSPAT